MSIDTLSPKRDNANILGRKGILMWKIIVLLSITLLQAGEIKIAVAANMGYAIEALKVSFHKKYPQTTVQVILGSSGKLSAQIQYGAPFELFLSANMTYPNLLHKAGFTTDKAEVYAQGALALFSASKRDFTSKLGVLAGADISKIAMANPNTAPYGVASKEALVKAKLYEKLKDKLVYGESAAQTLTYAKHAVEIAIIAKSALYARQMSVYKEGVHWIEIDKEMYRPIDQGMVWLKSAKDKLEVKAFYDFMLSQEAKEILQNFGYHV